MLPDKVNLNFSGFSVHIKKIVGKLLKSYDFQFTEHFLLFSNRSNLRTWGFDTGVNRVTIWIRTAGRSTTEKTLESRRSKTGEFRYVSSFVSIVTILSF
jgi:hypothetical protein